LRDAAVFPFTTFTDRLDFAAVVALLLAVVFLTVVFLAVAFLAVGFFAVVFMVAAFFGVAFFVVVFLADLPPDTVFFAEELRPPAVFLTPEPRLVDFPFDEVAFLVERGLLFFEEADDFFLEELFLLTADLRADEPALFFVPLLFLAEERGPVDFLVVAI